MIKKANPDATYIQSSDVVAREIEGTIIIIPVVSGIGDLENELFTLNETGKAIWQKLDGHRTLKEIITELKGEYEASGENDIEEEVVGLVSELIKRRIIVEQTSE